MLFCCVVVACSEPEPEALPPDEIVSSAATRMSDLQGFRFLIDSSGAPVFLDPDEIITLSRAEGYYVAPDRAQAVVGIVTPAMNFIYFSKNFSCRGYSNFSRLTFNIVIF